VLRTGPQVKTCCADGEEDLLLRLWLLFVVVPLLELAILIWIGQWVGAWVTVGAVILIGATGAWLAKHQGLRTWARIRESLSRGAMPGGELLDGLLILIAAVLLITPGVLTDIAALLLFVPAVRTFLKRRLTVYFRKRLRVVERREGPEIVDAE
jgi:UPF0716 protein FxsA